MSVSASHGPNELRRTSDLLVYYDAQSAVPIDTSAEVFESDVNNNSNENYLETSVAQSLRASDVFQYILALALSVVLLPLIGVIAIAVAFTSGFPVFYIQKRVGRDGKIFSMFKFRTMVRNAHDLKSHLMHLNIMSGPFFKVKNDPRVTKMGKFLRKTSFDELPQLFNVLKGEMSLVGPRPMLPEEVSKLRCYDILSVRPGITGIWQVSGRNEIVNFQKKLAMDRLYVSRRSFTMDLALLFKTIFVVFDRRGAY